MPLGASYSPLSQDPTQQKPQAGAHVQEAIKMLSLRMPRVQGAQALAPSQLLNAPGSEGMSMEALRKLLQQLSGGGAGAPASPAAPTLAPPSVPSPAAPSLAPPDVPSLAAPSLAPPSAPSFAPSPSPTIPAAPSPAETAASWMSPSPSIPAPQTPPPMSAPAPAPSAPQPAPPPTAPKPKVDVQPLPVGPRPWDPSFSVPMQAEKPQIPLNMPPGWDINEPLPFGSGKRRQA